MDGRDLAQLFEGTYLDVDPCGAPVHRANRRGKDVLTCI